MGRIYADLSISLDGFIAGPNVSVENGLGDGGERLHDWIFAGKTDAEVAEFMNDRFGSVGAVVMGRTMLDVGIGPWGDEPPFHAPVFVVTHRASEIISRRGGTTFTFITDGPSAALEAARIAAGHRDIRIEGGASVVRHFRGAGVIDELGLHIVPILLGSGTRLFVEGDEPSFDLSATGHVDEDGVAHLQLSVGGIQREASSIDSGGGPGRGVA
jgi:dihydrofolate reductase